MQNQYTAVFEKRGRWYVATVEEVPGVNTQGRTLDEARENLREALELIISANRELAARRCAKSLDATRPVRYSLRSGADRHHRPTVPATRSGVIQGA